jgi:hypothetical protein
MGGYDGDVLFENLELVRTVRAHGGTEARPADLFVRRLPRDAGRFWRQRVRQAYDDLAEPARLAVVLSLLPACGAAGVAALRHDRRWWAVPAGVAAAAVVAADVGRRCGGGRAVFPRTGALFAPVWLAERPPRILDDSCCHGDNIHPRSRGFRAGSAPPGARKPISLWVPSQNGRIADLPHRHSATVPRRASMRAPSWVRISKSPRISSGPSSYGVTVAPGLSSSIMPGRFPAAAGLIRMW